MSAEALGPWLARKDEAARSQLWQALSTAERRLLLYDWPLWRRPEQAAPAGEWDCWLVLAGRGFGKTRSGAEWVREQAMLHPEARVALVAASLGEARAVMVEGESGLLAVSPPGFRPTFEPSLRRLTWPNGAQAQLFSAAEPEALRGAQHSHAWCDEIGKWDNAAGRAVAAWDNLRMGLRLGAAPRLCATTTPRAVPLVQRLLAEAAAGKGVVLTRGATMDNARNLPAQYLAAMEHLYGGTSLGRQELLGEILTDRDGALWTRAMLEAARSPRPPVPQSRVVIGVDPPASAGGDACGIVACARGEDGQIVVLADCSVEGASPERWARAVAATAAEWSADRVVAEANQGGAMVESVLRAASIDLPVKLVHASRGKSARAEPVAALYETGRVHHAGMFAMLEDQLCGLMAGGAYQGPGRSPDRADALVWAIHELTAAQARPMVRPL